MTRDDIEKATLSLAIERTYSSWLRVSVWVYSLGILGMNSNQILAAADLGVRLKAPIFISGGLLALSATVAVEVHYREYRTRISDLGDTLLMVSRRPSFTTRVLQAVMIFAAFGSAWYGAAEVVEIN
jgi:hypothetical protein